MIYPLTIGFQTGENLLKDRIYHVLKKDKEITQACYGTGYTLEIAEHLDLKTWTFLGKSQKDAWGGYIRKLNEDKRAEERRIANLQSASSSSNQHQSAPISKAMPGGDPPDQGNQKKPDPFNFDDGEK